MQIPPAFEMHVQPDGHSALALHARVQSPSGKPPPVWQRPVAHCPFAVHPTRYVPSSAEVPHATRAAERRAIDQGALCVFFIEECTPDLDATAASVRLAGRGSVFGLALEADLALCVDPRLSGSPRVLPKLSQESRHAPQQLVTARWRDCAPAVDDGLERVGREARGSRSWALRIVSHRGSRLRSSMRYRETPPAR